MANLHFFVGI